MPKKYIIDPAAYDLNQIVADIDEIRKYNRQRYEMEQLSGVVYEDVPNRICVGYRDLTDDEFWTRGHMPDFPLMPGVIMCEAAAQLACYFTQKHNLMELKEGQFLGFGGLDEVRFRGIVRPGSRLVIQAEVVRIKPGAMCVCRFANLVGDALVSDGVIKGIPISAG